jgi:hypothetical protein
MIGSAGAAFRDVGYVSREMTELLHCRLIWENEFISNEFASDARISKTIASDALCQGTTFSRAGNGHKLAGFSPCDTTLSG